MSGPSHRRFLNRMNRLFRVRLDERTDEDTPGPLWKVSMGEDRGRLIRGKDRKDQRESGQ